MKQTLRPLSAQDQHLLLKFSTHKTNCSQLKSKSMEASKHKKQIEINAKQQAEVVSFLVSSIQLVKQKAAEEELHKAATATTSTTTASPKPAHFAASLRERIVKAGGSIDVTQLTWLEREQVLRLLLSQVNASKINKVKDANADAEEQRLQAAAFIVNSAVELKPSGVQGSDKSGAFPTWSNIHAYAGASDDIHIGNEEDVLEQQEQHRDELLSSSVSPQRTPLLRIVTATSADYEVAGVQKKHVSFPDNVLSPRSSQGDGEKELQNHRPATNVR